MSNQVLIEVCVDSAASASAAERGGASRVELCSSLIEGGVTPSAGLIELVRSKARIGLHVMIRPRGGDFCYVPGEFETMRRDIIVAKNLGADGVVFGILEASGNVDTQRTRVLVELARPLQVTFHRAVDMSADLFRGLEDVCTTGADRLLTSGGEQSALEAVSQIARLRAAAGGRIAIMACGGIDDKNAAAIIEKTGVREIHVGLRSPVASAMTHQNPKLSMGTVTGREYQRFEVLEENVRKLSAAVALARV
jgi:copper homeostasis protein